MYFLQQKGDDDQKKPAQVPKEVQQVRDKVGLMNKKGSVKEGEPPLPKGNYYRIWQCQPTVEGATAEGSLEIRKPVKWEMLQRERVLTLLSQLDPSRVTLSSISVVSACVLQVLLGLWQMVAACVSSTYIRYLTKVTCFRSCPQFSCTDFREIPRRHLRRDRTPSAYYPRGFRGRLATGLRTSDCVDSRRFEVVGKFVRILEH